MGGPNPTCCPLCQKVCLSGEALMEHMKFVHKDPNASGVPGKTYFLCFIKVGTLLVIGLVRFLQMPASSTSGAN